MESSKKFRLKSCIIGTYELEESGWNRLSSPSIGKIFDTSICYNNDNILGKIRLNRGFENSHIVSKIPPQMTDQYNIMMDSHIRNLGVNHIDIMLIHNARSDWKDLAVKLNNDRRIGHVGVSNFSISDIEEYKSLIGKYPEYNEMEINPNYYDKDLIEYCHEKGIQIIAYAIFGGKYNARENFRYYTMYYLLEFASYHAEYIIVRSDDPYELVDMITGLSNNIIGKEVSNPSIYEIESTTGNKSINPVNKYRYPKFIYGIRDNISGRLMVTYSNKHYNMHDVELVGESVTIDDISGVRKSSNLDEEWIYKYLTDLQIPEYEFITDYRVFFRYQLENLLKLRVDEYYKNDILVIMYQDDSCNTKMLCFNVYLLNESEGKLSKVNDGKCKLVIDLIVNTIEYGMGN